jgi:predicted ATPase
VLGVEFGRLISGESIESRRKAEPISFTYQGSVLSQLRDETLPAPLIEMRDALRNIRSLELLSPNLMRRRARNTDDDIGAGGEKLSAFLHGIKGPQRDQLLTLIRQFYPQVTDFKITSQKSGWKKLSVFEQYGDHRIETEARHLNDGLLRVLAILAQTTSDRSLVLLDEIENGINQEIVEPLVNALVASPQQTIVTTHSPLILNYLSDDTARQAVQFIYKTPQGETKVRRFFSIPRINEKLRCMGPGDAFVDTDLRALTEECIALDAAELLAKPTPGRAA